MIDIGINDELRLCSYSMNIWFEQRQEIKRGKNKGSFKWVEVGGYHGSIALALNGFTKKKIREADAKSFDELKTAIENLNILLDEIHKSIIEKK